MRRPMHLVLKKFPARLGAAPLTGVALACSVLVTNSAHAAPPVELVVQADHWCPYNCEPDSARPGYAVELLQAIFEPGGVRVHYQVVPWDRAVLQTREGKADAAIGATQKEADANGFLIGNESIGYSSDCLFVAADSKLKFSSADDLNGLKRLGTSSGYTFSDDIDAWLHKPENQHKIYPQKGADPTAINARNLALGRLDGVLEDDHVMQEALFKLGLGNQVALAGCRNQTQIFIAFSPKLKNASEVIKKFDEGMAALRQNKRLARILAKYGLSDWK